MTFQTQQSGFTLIELSIVLVLVGLIVGGVLVGKDLIQAAEIRAQVAQIDGYNTAIRTFQIKYGGLPGDLAAASASAFGFSTGDGSMNRGDGDGYIRCRGGGDACPQLDGEMLLVWAQLSQSNLIAGTFDPATFYGIGSGIPAMKINESNGMGLGRCNGIVLFAHRPNPMFMGQQNWPDPVDYSANNFYLGECEIIGAIAPSLTPAEALAIDSKIDDGRPLSGGMHALTYWIAGGTGIDMPSSFDGSSDSCMTTNVPATAQYTGTVTKASCAVRIRLQ
jgi:prepilin-type N-terminal cleavage/methylation domain-containing protein